MILSDKDIKLSLQNGDIQISDFQIDHLKPGSYTFTLNTTILIPITQGIIDSENTDIVYEEVVLGEEGYILQPGDFILGQTREQLSLANHIGCILDARTSLVRIGLLPLQGSTFVEPGQIESHETLEISNISRNPIRIHTRMKIVKGIFIQLTHPSEKGYAKIGKYAKQTKPNRII